MSTPSYVSQSISPTFQLLDSLPLEIRFHIFEYLLKNPILGCENSVPRGSNFGANIRYNLDCAILFTCQRHYQEASTVLYEHNTFFYKCARLDNCVSSGVMEHAFEACPITRYHYGRSIKSPFLEHNYPTLKRVQSWAIFVDPTFRLPPRVLPRLNYNWQMPRGLPIISMLMAFSQPKYVKVIIAIADSKAMDEICIPIAEWILPLLKFRKLSSINYRIKRPGYRGEWTYDPRIGQFRHFASQSLYEKTRLMLENVAMVPAFIELPQRMYEALSTYTKTFERHEPFRNEMDLGPWHVIARGREELSRGHEDTWSPNNPIQPYMINPFRVASGDGEHGHPVETHLVRALGAVVNLDVKAFKCERTKLLQYIETHYQEIKAGYLAAVNFIKATKRRGHCFNVNPTVTGDFDFHKKISTEHDLGVLILEDFAVNFHRKLPMAVRTSMRRDRLLFESIYNQMPREQMMKKLALAPESGDARDFRYWFKGAFQDMEHQFREIRAARKKLFDFDAPQEREWEHDIEMDFDLCDDEVEWSVNEPDFGPNLSL